MVFNGLPGLDAFIWNSHLEAWMKSWESESANSISTSNSKPRFGVPVCNGAEYGDEWKAINISCPLLKFNNKNDESLPKSQN